MEQMKLQLYNIAKNVQLKTVNFVQQTIKFVKNAIKSSFFTKNKIKSYV